jgi:hypothetical protein
VTAGLATPSIAAVGQERGLAGVGLRLRHDAPGREAVAAVRPAPVPAAWAPINVDPNRRVPLLLPEPRPALEPWQDALGNYRWLDTRRVDLTGGFALVRQQLPGGPLAGGAASSLLALGTVDAAGRPTAGALAYGDPERARLSARVAAVREPDPESAAERRWPWSHVASVATRLGGVAAEWTRAGSMARPDSAAEALTLAARAASRGREVEVRHERLGRGFARAGAALAAWDGIDDTRLLASGPGPLGRWTALADVLSPSRARTAFGGMPHAGARHEWHAGLRLDLAGAGEAYSTGAPPSWPLPGREHERRGRMAGRALQPAVTLSLARYRLPGLRGGPWPTLQVESSPLVRPALTVQTSARVEAVPLFASGRPGRVAALSAALNHERDGRLTSLLVGGGGTWRCDAVVGGGCGSAGSTLGVAARHLQRFGRAASLDAELRAGREAQRGATRGALDAGVAAGLPGTAWSADAHTVAARLLARWNPGTTPGELTAGGECRRAGARPGCTATLAVERALF